MEFHSIKQDNELTLSPLQIELKRRYIDSLKDGTAVRITLTREGRAKTHQQIKTHFGLVVEMIRQRFIEMGVDVCGIAPNKSMIHDILKKACGGVGDMGENLGLSEMTAIQASKFFENCRVWCATQLQLNVPDPDPNWKDKKPVIEKVKKNGK